MLPTCVAEVVCSEAFLNTWSDFWKKNKNKNKKTTKFKNCQMRKLQVVWQSWLILLLSFFFVFLFKMGLLKSRWLNCLLLCLKNANIQSSCSIITSLISPKALSCTFFWGGVVQYFSGQYEWSLYLTYLIET